MAITIFAVISVLVCPNGPLACWFFVNTFVGSPILIGDGVIFRLGQDQFACLLVGGYTAVKSSISKTEISVVDTEPAFIGVVDGHVYRRVFLLFRLFDRLCSFSFSFISFFNLPSRFLLSFPSFLLSLLGSLILLSKASF
jgi:hypothetical protein